MPDPDNEQYVARAEAMNAEYLKAWENLSPQLRAAMDRLGVGKPELIDYDSKQGGTDVSDFVELKAVELDLSERDEFAISLSEIFDISPAKAHELVPWLLLAVERKVLEQKTDYLASVIAMLLVEANVKVSVIGLAFALDLMDLQMHRADLSSMRKAAKFVGCTASYLSQHANKWCDRLGLPRPKCMKSQEVRQTYAEERKTNHWRNQTC